MMWEIDISYGMVVYKKLQSVKNLFGELFVIDLKNQRCV